MSQKAKTLPKKYNLRFHNTQKYRTEFWKILFDSYFSCYIFPEHVVLDMGAGVYAMRDLQFFLGQILSMSKGRIGIFGITLFL